MRIHKSVSQLKSFQTNQYRLSKKEIQFKMKMSTVAFVVVITLLSALTLADPSARKNRNNNNNNGGGSTVIVCRCPTPAKPCPPITTAAPTGVPIGTGPTTGNTAPGPGDGTSG